MHRIRPGQIPEHVHRRIQQLRECFRQNGHLMAFTSSRGVTLIYYDNPKDGPHTTYRMVTARLIKPDTPPPGERVILSVSYSDAGRWKRLLHVTDKGRPLKPLADYGIDEATQQRLLEILGGVHISDDSVRNSDVPLRELHPQDQQLLSDVLYGIHAHFRPQHRDSPNTPGTGSAPGR